MIMMKMMSYYDDDDYNYDDNDVDCNDYGDDHHHP